MLENIKLLLNITDEKHDNMILLYLSKVETMDTEQVEESPL